MHRRGNLRRFAVAATACAAVLASCSDGDGGGGSGSSAPAPDGGQAAAPLARYADHRSEHYDDPSRWVCRPDTEDVCDGDLDATVVEADGTTRVEEFTPAEDPPIDCFYVYPTISRDESTYSDWEPSSEEEGFVTLQQAARLGQVCRVFAPVYRQLTLTALIGRLGGGGDTGGDRDGEDEGDRPAERGDPFADVLDAFRTYMANDNEGRGFVLIGHSQGSGMLTRLIAEEVDPHEDVRELLVAAYLVGSSVTVPEGEVVGGDFQHVPLCTRSDETGCVLTWATFRAGAPPPPGALFGRPRRGEGVAGCVNPAAVEGGSAELHPYLPADASASILSALGTDGSGGSWLEGTTIDTPFVTLPGFVTGRCTSRDGFSYLEVEVHADPSDPRADDLPGDLTPEWGLHLVDVSVAMGDIVDRVAAQAAAFTGSSGTGSSGG